MYCLIVSTLDCIISCWSAVPVSEKFDGYFTSTLVCWQSTPVHLQIVYCFTSYTVHSQATCSLLTCSFFHSQSQCRRVVRPRGRHGLTLYQLPATSYPPAAVCTASFHSLFTQLCCEGSGPAQTDLYTFSTTSWIFPRRFHSRRTIIASPTFISQNDVRPS